MNVMYLLPVVAIGGTLLYTRWAQANVKKRAAAGGGPQMFHNAYAEKFPVLQGDERLIGMFMGQAYITPTSTAAQALGKFAKEAALAAGGLTTYTPVVYVGVTTHGRTLVAEEYTEMGKRNNYKVVRAFPAGTRVLSGQAAHPEHQGAPPKNYHSADAPLELVRLVGQNEDYLCWVNGAGSFIGASSFVSITNILPITAEKATTAWQNASRPQASVG